MEQSSELDLKRVLQLMYKKKALLLVSAACVSTVIVIFSYLLPKTYEAKSVIFIERNVLNELIKDVTVTPLFEEKVKALEIVMKSRSLILKVLTDLDIDLASKSPDAVEGTIQHFQQNTEISIETNKATRNNMDLFIVSYKGSDPKMASKYVNALVRRYIEENLAIKREEAYGASQFLLDQIAAFKVKLEKIESAIARQRKDKNIPEKSASLYDQLEPLYRKKNELLVQYTESHPDVMKVKSEIERLEQQMKNAAATSTPDTGIIDLERERETTKKIYEDLLATLRKSEVSTQLEVQDKAGAFRILDPAMVPTKPLSPNMVQMILLAILGGVAAGTGLIIVIDMNDKSVKTVQTIRKMGLPVLAVISTMQTPQETAAAREKDRRIYALAALYLACLLTIASMEMMGLPYVNDFIQGAKAGVGSTMKKILKTSRGEQA